MVRMVAGESVAPSAHAPLGSSTASAVTSRSRLKRKLPEAVAVAPAAEVPRTSIRSPHWHGVLWVLATSIDQISVGMILTANYKRRGKCYLAEVLSVQVDPEAVSVRYEESTEEDGLLVSDLRVQSE